MIASMSVKTISCRVSQLLHRRVCLKNAMASSAMLTPARSYYKIRRSEGSERNRVVDLRSDTVTKPGVAMRRAMFEADVGDDVMGEDPAVNELQDIAARMFGMEAAIFVPSGTMGNLIAVMVHCRERGDEMIVGDQCHVHIYEQGGSAQLAGVHATTVPTLPDGTFDLDQVESKIRHGYPDPHYPRTRLICVENTHNIRGGRVLPLGFLQKVRRLADEHGLMVHMDGARVMNAAVAQGIPVKSILQHVHTVSVCLSKGLGAPVGTMLAGPEDFIRRAIRCRKALGGGMRQTGILAAAGKVSLLEMVERLKEDHENTKAFAEGLLASDDSPFTFDLAAVETNILRFGLKPSTLTSREFCAHMAGVAEGEEEALGQGIQVLMFPQQGNTVRAVFHLGISAEDTQLAVQKVNFVLSQHRKGALRAC